MDQHEMAKWITATKYSHLPLRRLPVPANRIIEALAHRRDRGGVVVSGAEIPVVAFELDDRVPTRLIRELQLTPSAFGIVPYFWGTPAGNIFTITTMIPGTKRWLRAGILEGSRSFEQLQSGRLALVFVRGRAIIRTLEVAYPSTLSASLAKLYETDRVDPVVSDEDAAYWYSLSGSIKDVSASERERWSPMERLRCGWALHFLGLMEEILSWSYSVKQTEFSEDYLNPTAHRLVEALLGGADGFQDFCSLLDDEYDRHGVHPLNTIMDHGHKDERTPLLLAGHILYTRSPYATNHGSELCWFDAFTGERARREIDPDLFLPDFDPFDYWQEMSDLFIHTGGLLEPDEAPVTSRSREESIDAGMPSTTETNEAIETAFGLLNEASSNRQGSIPLGAFVQLAVGPFRGFRFYELRGEVAVVGETATPERWIFFLPMPRTGMKADSWRALIGVDGLPEENRAALVLLFAAIIRDFLVVERRERVFAQSGSPRQEGKRANPADRITYIPRIRYETVGSASDCREELRLRERRKHQVRPHLRRSDSCSPLQRVLAKRYGFDLIPNGFTFVQPHERGKSADLATYRSRSALAMLFRSDDTVTATSHVDWFQFERDVATLMRGMRFHVEHKDASRSGDAGVDLVATKGRDLNRVSWLVQCKCYSPQRTVGVAKIRELVGALQDHPRGFRGMVVTTSRYSKGARSLAHKHDVRLIDGAEFSRLVLGSISDPESEYPTVD